MKFAAWCTRCSVRFVRSTDWTGTKGRTIESRNESEPPHVGCYGDKGRKRGISPPTGLHRGQYWERRGNSGRTSLVILKVISTPVQGFDARSFGGEFSPQGAEELSSDEWTNFAANEASTVRARI